MGKPDAPAQPDYLGAAKAEAKGNVQAAIVNSLLNRPSQVNPYGSQIWEQTGTATIPGFGKIPTYTGTTTLSPEMQQLFDQQTQTKLGLGNQAQSALATPLDFSGLGNYNQNVADAIYGRATAYMDPQWQQSEERERNRLLNAGFSVGNEGFTKAMQDFGQRKDLAYGDARDRAIIAGTDMGLRDRQQAIAELLTQRTQPLNELAALNSGAGVQVPQFPSGNIGANVQGPNLLGATQAQGQAANDIYNADVGTYNSNMQTAGSLGAAAIAAMFF